MALVRSSSIVVSLGVAFVCHMMETRFYSAIGDVLLLVKLIFKCGYHFIEPNTEIGFVFPAQ
jgi:hypothetical protein